jgi:transformer-2 protein
MSTMDYETEQRVYDGTHSTNFTRLQYDDYYDTTMATRLPDCHTDEPRDYERDERDDRSRSPRRDRHEDNEARQRSASPNGRVRGEDSRYSHPLSLRMSHQQLTPPSGPPADNRRDVSDAGSENPGSNLFVTGIASRVRDDELVRAFEKYGEVTNAHIMRDPHSNDSRGFGFVKFASTEQAEAAIEGLHGTNFEGRTLSVEKARRNRPRTPTPGKYHGPPKKGKHHITSCSFGIMPSLMRLRVSKLLLLSLLLRPSQIC